MNRREFLKLGSAAIAVAVFPEIAVDATRSYVIGVDLGGDDYSSAVLVETDADGRDTIVDHWEVFDPSHNYGNGLRLYARPTEGMEKKMLGRLYEDMQKWIPPGFRHRVEVEQRRVDYDTAVNVTWRYRGVIV